MIELFVPQQSSERLSLHHPCILGEISRRQSVIKLIGLMDPFCEDVIECRRTRNPTRLRFIGQPQTNDFRCCQETMISSYWAAAFDADLLGIDGIYSTVNDIVIETVFHIFSAIVIAI